MSIRTCKWIRPINIAFMGRIRILLVFSVFMSWSDSDETEGIPAGSCGISSDSSAELMVPPQAETVVRRVIRVARGHSTGIVCSFLAAVRTDRGVDRD